MSSNDREADGEASPPSADRPIERQEDDVLGRTGFAAQITLEITSAPRAAGFVVAVTGAWGSGKTSVINMAMEPLETEGSGFHIVRFNPWLFSGAPQLLEHFLAQFGSHFSKQSQSGESASSVNSTTDIADQMNDHHGLASDAKSSVWGASTRGYGGQHRRWPLASTAMVIASARV